MDAISETKTSLLELAPVGIDKVDLWASDFALADSARRAIVGVERPALPPAPAAIVPAEGGIVQWAKQNWVPLVAVAVGVALLGGISIAFFGSKPALAAAAAL